MLTRFLENRTTCQAALIGTVAYLAISKLGFHFECLILKWVSIPCPLCGLTRGTIQLFQGNFPQAIHYHLFSPLIIAGALLMLGRSFGGRRIEAFVILFCTWIDRFRIPEGILMLLIFYWAFRQLGGSP